MATRPLPRLLAALLPGAAAHTRRPGRGRALARSAADGAADTLHPLITVTRGLRVLGGRARRWWAATPSERRGPVLVLAGASALVVALLPYGPLGAALALLASAAWAGRAGTSEASAPGPDETGAERLATLYEALVPYFHAAGDTEDGYCHGGDWAAVFDGYAFDEDGRPTRLRLRYPARFTDGEPEARARVEQVLCAKSGRGREYLFDWDQEANRLTMAVLPALSTTIRAQRFVTAPGETVLGFTDGSSAQRTLPVFDGAQGPRGESAAGPRDVPAVVWRTGPRSTEPHLLALGQPGSGTTTLLRSVAIQALHHGDVLVVDGAGTGEYAFLAGRAGVLAVECGLGGALATLEWAARETERRLLAAGRARQFGHPAPEDVRRPLWLVVDRPSVLGQLAAADGRPDPRELLGVPLRHGRTAHVRVVVGDQLDAADALGKAVWANTRARVVLGQVTPEQVRAVLGEPPRTTPAPEAPCGRGYARVGTGPVHRLQVPATPDPYDDATSETQREAVLGLLPERFAPGPYDSPPQGPGSGPGAGLAAGPGAGAGAPSLRKAR
ncbi:hypothetical protein RKE29_04915, partial [Streptomyces sp. B1866]|uniref:hypothetical protein n=1 Tax=Streptomyces sp. B1866 TaxID=3075431 RepID=UPI002890AAFC